MLVFLLAILFAVHTMAYDPRTGIQTFAQADPSADVNAAIDVPEAKAPSTATALPPRGPAPTSMDELYDRYYGGDWRTVDPLDMFYSGMSRPSPGASFDTYNGGWLGGARPRDVAYKAAQAGSIEDWLYALDQTGPVEYVPYTGERTADGRLPPAQFRNLGGGYNRWGYLGEDMIRGPLDQIAGAAGVEGVDWAPYLDEYWFDEWNDQLAHGRNPGDIFSYKQGYGDILTGVSGLAGFGDIAAENIGPGTDFYGQYNELPNWIKSRRDEATWDRGVATMLPVLTGLLAPYITPAISSAAGGGALGTIAGGAAMGGLQGLFTGDPIGGAVRGGISAGVPVAAGAAADYVGGADGMLSRLGFSGDAAFADTADGIKRVGSQTAPMNYLDDFATPEFFADAGMLGQAGPTGPIDVGENIAAAGRGAEAARQGFLDLNSLLATEASPGKMDAPKPEVESKEPGMLDKAGKYVKLGQMLSQLGGGGDAPQDAPQRQEGQSDEQYVQDLADYANVNVDARALAEMGLTPGTPQYYEYLMGQLDNVLAGYEDAEDLMGQLRGKTQDEITALRRALFVRGQLEQLMGSGTYTDPFSGLATEVIDAGGRGVNPGMAAYHRGLGNTIEGFAGLDPTARREEIGSFLGRDVDLYGAQGRMDARAEQEAMVQMFLEDLKKRQGGMLRGAFWE